MRIHQENLSNLALNLCLRISIKEKNLPKKDLKFCFNKAPNNIFNKAYKLFVSINNFDECSLVQALGVNITFLCFH